MMIRRLLGALLLLATLAPTGIARADLTVGSGAAGTDNASTQSTAATTLQNTGQASASNSLLSTLQPANGAGSTSPLQSANAQGAGLSQSDVQNLQQSGTSDQAKLLISGEGDQPHQLGQSWAVTWLGYVLIVMLAATILTGIVWLLQRRQWLPVSLPV